MLRIYQSGSSEKPKKLVREVADFDAPLIFVQAVSVNTAKVEQRIKNRRITIKLPSLKFERQNRPENSAISKELILSVTTCRIQ